MAAYINVTCALSMIRSLSSHSIVNFAFDYALISSALATVSIPCVCVYTYQYIIIRFLYNCSMLNFLAYSSLLLFDCVLDET